MVMFTYSKCTLSTIARRLMDENYPSQTYYFYDYNKDVYGAWFSSESTVAIQNMKQWVNHTTLPHVWLCGNYVGGKILLDKNSFH